MNPPTEPSSSRAQAVTTASELPAIDGALGYILRCQTSDGAIPWFAQGKLDPWDHTEAAMALTAGGYLPQARRAYDWLLQNQLPHGAWYAEYQFHRASNGYQAGPTQRVETHFVAYIATGVWHFYLTTGDRAFLQAMYPAVERALRFVLQWQAPEGDIAWAVDEQGQVQDDALVTGCSSIYLSLRCGIHIAEALAVDAHPWQQASTRLAEALRTKPQRFDRTWPSKQRFAMDWYYPILSGLYSQAQARTRLSERWPAFVEPELGCRCVSDEPWVTTAETAELVMALCSTGEHTQAEHLFQCLRQWQDRDGGFWTGYVFRDHAIWPEEKTTWSCAAVVLAAEALMTKSPTATLFGSVEPSLENERLSHYRHRG